MIALLSDTDTAEVTGKKSWITSLRENALLQSKSLSWPTISVEEYRRTDLSSFPFDSFVFADNPENKDNAGEHSPLFSGVSAVIFSNNSPVYLNNTIEGVQIKFLSQLDSKESAFYYEQYRKDLNDQKDKITLWNYEKLKEGIIVDIKDSVKVKEPVLIEYQVDENKCLVVPNVFIRARVMSEVMVILLLRGKNGTESCINSVIHSYTEDGAKLHLVKLQNLPLEATLFNHEKHTIGRDATVVNHDIHFGGKLVKSSAELTMNGQGSTLDAEGLFFAKDQHFDLNVLLHHKEARGASRALYKGCIDGKGRAVFKGMIDVEENAFATDAYLANKNLILSDEGRADSIPGLHIANNNVKCSHGSTSGKINQEELFYLESRGLSKDEARATIVSGFLGELTKGLSEEVKKYIDSAIAEKNGSMIHSEEINPELWNNE